MPCGIVLTLVVMSYVGRMGMCALRNQLHALGVIASTDSREIPFDCDACRLLEEL